MAIVWPTTLSVETYSAAGKNVEVPRADCPSCAAPMTFWSGYWRFVRQTGHDHRIWVTRGRCTPCDDTHALLPAFVAKNRLDSVETIGLTLEAVCSAARGVQRAADQLGVPSTTVRGWVRRFSQRAPDLAVAFSALAIELGADVLTPLADPARHALASIAHCWRAAAALPGWRLVHPWRFCSTVCGGALLATNTNTPWFVIGKRRFMPPVP
jgi:hypothetical protein